jgi:hypothetical protein
MKHTLTLALLIGLAPLTANAVDRVLSVSGRSISVSNSARSTWAADDSVCLYQSRVAVACGQVERVGDADLRILAETAPRVAVGDRVYLRPNVRHPASSSVTEVYEDIEPSKIADFSAGVAVGPNYFYPTAHIQFALGRQISIGVMPIFVNYDQKNTNVRAYGGFATLNYYLTHSTFRGLYFQGGGGFYNITNTVGTTQETLSPGAVMGSVQWRGRALWGLGLDIGVGAGAQYVFKGAQTVTSSFKGFLPMFTAFLGYSF